MKKLSLSEKRNLLYVLQSYSQFAKDFDFVCVRDIEQLKPMKGLEGPLFLSRGSISDDVLTRRLEGNYGFEIDRMLIPSVYQKSYTQLYLKLARDLKYAKLVDVLCNKAQENMSFDLDISDLPDAESITNFKHTLHEMVSVGLLKSFVDAGYMVQLQFGVVKYVGSLLQEWLPVFNISQMILANLNEDSEVYYGLEVRLPSLRRKIMLDALIFDGNHSFWLQYHRDELPKNGANNLFMGVSSALRISSDHAFMVFDHLGKDVVQNARYWKVTPFVNDRALPFKLKKLLRIDQDGEAFEETA